MNAAFNEDQGPSVKVAVTEIVRQKAVSLPSGLSAHMLRDIGLPPDDG
jgi:hypothetical protein